MAGFQLEGSLRSGRASLMAAVMYHHPGLIVMFLVLSWWSAYPGLRYIRSHTCAIPHPARWLRMLH